MKRNHQECFNHKNELKSKCKFHNVVAKNPNCFCWNGIFPNPLYRNMNKKGFCFFTNNFNLIQNNLQKNYFKLNYFQPFNPNIFKKNYFQKFKATKQAKFQKPKEKKLINGFRKINVQTSFAKCT